MSASKLAILGGTPAFAEPLHVGRPNVGDRQRVLALVSEILDRRWLTNGGPVVKAFEQRLAERFGVRHCVATSNATVGLELAYAEAGLRGEVIVPSFTFVGTVHALLRIGCTPLFCEIDPATHCIDPDAAEALITPRTTGIVGVHLWGRTCDVFAFERLARARGLQLIFDAAHAFGCSVSTRNIGTFGRAEVFSFHATKVLNTFEGGAIATDDDDLAERLRRARNFGFIGYDDVVSLGTNAKMPEVSAAMGLVNLAEVDEFIAVNRRNQSAYRRTLAGLSGIHFLPFQEQNRSNYQYVVIEVDPAEAGLSRDDLLEVLHAENVLARRYFWPGVHRMEPYRTVYADASLQLPLTERIASRVLVLPSGTQLDEDGIETIGQIVRTALTAPDRIRFVQSCAATA